MPYAPIPPEVERVTRDVIGAAIEVHRGLGPGFLEGVYERALAHELELRNLSFRRQVPIVISYKEVKIAGQRLDLVVDPGVVVEVKAVERLLPIHKAQVYSYLRSTGYRIGLLLNFNCEILKQGIKRIVK